ncbi:MAG TPA: serine/threonine-protein kinase, partial [Phycisphaerae bacterium]|nr:serine/threonine-protein kinase [Phycisphaerae bacterium]
MSDRRAQVKEVFFRVAEAEPSTRLRLLDELCGDDHELRRRVQALLDTEADASSADDLLEKPPLGAALDSGFPGAASPEPDGDLTTDASRYRIIRCVGRGGMGDVYEAEQHATRRRVAIKFIRHGLGSREAQRRFRHETEILGRLNHPGVVRIYEAGTATFALSDGSSRAAPFLAMEYIEGQPLTVFANEHDLDLRSRLELMVRVCDAVQYAHQMGVIHRDLKPANILVEPQRGTASGATAPRSAARESSSSRSRASGSLNVAQPKVLDFGVARATEADLHLTTLQTRAGQLMGTPAYMSPEQIGGDPLQVDTRTDVYALGVILYELLAGRLPLDVAGAPLAEAMRRITEVEPAPLGRVKPELRGELAAIAAKALAKDRERRYESPLA